MRAAPEVTPAHDTAERVPPGKIRCDACPVLCFIAEGRAGACDRYANQGGDLVRLDPHVVLAKGGPVVAVPGEWDGAVLPSGHFVTAVGAGTTYPDWKPAPFIVASQMDGVDMVMVVTEGIHSYCGVKVKIDTDRHIGPEQASVRLKGEAVGHVTTGEYGSQMLSLGRVYHLTGGSKYEGQATCAALLDLCRARAVELEVEGGAALVVQAGAPPVVDGVTEARMSVGCGSAAIGMFAPQWFALADEVVVEDDHITGVMSEHQAGKLLGVPPSGIRIRGHKSTPGRSFRVAGPGGDGGARRFPTRCRLWSGSTRAMPGPGCGCWWRRPRATMRRGMCWMTRCGPCWRRCPRRWPPAWRGCRGRRVRIGRGGGRILHGGASGGIRAGRLGPRRGALPPEPPGVFGGR